MKKNTNLILLGITIGLASIYSLRLTLSTRSPAAHSDGTTIDSPADSNSNTINKLLLPRNGFRPSVAFILGNDKQAENPYYEQALRYYTTNPKAKTDFVVTECRSLEEMKSYLADHAVLNAQPWGDIHLISHGNQWSGLSVKVAPQSKRATTQRILEYTRSPEFIFLPSSVVDDLTRIFLHSCGVGNDANLVEAVRSFLGCPQSLPTVYAPRLFEFYTSDAAGKNSQRYLAQSWLVCYRFGEQPSTLSLMNELREKYVEVAIDWKDALERSSPRWVGDTYHYTFDVPVKWIVPVDARPDLTDEILQMEWLAQQPQIGKELDRLHLPLEKFKWTFVKGYAQGKDGEKKAAINVTGYCTMLCVIKTMTHEPTTADTSPATEITDPRYYYKTTSPLLATNDTH